MHEHLKWCGLSDGLFHYNQQNIHCHVFNCVFQWVFTGIATVAVWETAKGGSEQETFLLGNRNLFCAMQWHHAWVTQQRTRLLLWHLLWAGELKHPYSASHVHGWQHRRDRSPRLAWCKSLLKQVQVISNIWFCFFQWKNPLGVQVINKLLGNRNIYQFWLLDFPPLH